MGFCPQCGSGNPLVEVADVGSHRSEPSSSVPVTDAARGEAHRAPTGWPEVDRVLGGGLVPGSVVLLGGEPGVGKSTLLLQLAGTIAAGGGQVVIASAEESIEQVAMRATRLGMEDSAISLVADDDVDAVVALADTERPAVLVVDSIQTVGVSEIASAPGGVGQVRESAARLIRLAKTSETTVILVGHVTKEGGLAGPKILEHMVDVVLYLEGDPDHGFRVLRSTKKPVWGDACVRHVRHALRWSRGGCRPLEGVSPGLGSRCSRDGRVPCRGGETVGARGDPGSGGSQQPESTAAVDPWSRPGARKPSAGRSTAPRWAPPPGARGLRQCRGRLADRRTRLRPARCPRNSLVRIGPAAGQVGVVGRDRSRR